MYDIRDNGSDIPYASGKFKNALDFLDWYSVPLMSGFGLIIIDDTNPSLYIQ